MILIEESTVSLPGTDKKTCDMLGGCTALLGELHTQKAQSYTFIPTERVGSIHFISQMQMENRKEKQKQIVWNQSDETTREKVETA